MMADNGAFKCRYLYIWAKPPLSAKVIEDPRITELAGRKFLVGEYIGRPSRPSVRDGCTIWVPVDDVVSLVEFQDRTRLDEALSEWDRPDAPDKK
jgi:hypothetical protein